MYNTDDMKKIDTEKMMGRYRCVFFDFDGTLVNSGISITDTVRYTLEKRGIIETDQDKLRLFIGPPLVDSYMGLYGFSKEEALEAVEDYRDIYRKKNMFNVDKYEGMRDTLDTLKRKGIVLCIASSKPLPLVEKISEYLDIAQYFEAMFGATYDGRLLNKIDVLNEAMKYLETRYPDMEPKDVLMVGDRMYDAEGAAAVGIDCAGVSYGFAEDGELEKAGCSYIIGKPGDLVSLVG